MELPKKNPFCKASLNLTEQGILYKTDKKLYDRLKAEAPALDAEAERIKHTRTLYEFNQLDKTAQVKFIQGGGIIA